MVTQLFWVLVLFSVVAGVALASNHGSAWAVMVYSVAAVVAFQVSYVATLIVEALSER
jgi:hypothetical protein